MNLIAKRENNESRRRIKNIYEVSQCGFQGLNTSKTNQDSMIVFKNILNDNTIENYFFAVL